METETQKFKDLIDISERILITSHTSPDPDAVSSLLLLGSTLSLNFPSKAVHLVLEEQPDGLDFLQAYSQIKFQKLAPALVDLNPDFFIMVDVGNFGRASRSDGERVKQYISDNPVKTATIDHHQPEGRDEVDAYINTMSSAAAQEVYNLCFDQLNLKKPEGYAETTMLGLYADTGGFIYLGPDNKNSFELASELVGAGANLEVIKNRLTSYSQAQMAVISKLAANITHSGDYTYSFIADDFVDEWLKAGGSPVSLHRATKAFIDNYIRSVEGRSWGFITYKDVLDGTNTYSVSFRSIRFTKDVEKLAARLNGGGHKSAAGAKLEASNVEEAIEKVKAVILEP